MATATANSKKLLAPIKAPGVATLCRTLNQCIRQIGEAGIEIDLDEDRDRQQQHNDPVA